MTAPSVVPSDRIGLSTWPPGASCVRCVGLPGRPLRLPRRCASWLHYSVGIGRLRERPIRATGASFGQTFFYAVVPQVLVKTLGVLIYRLDSNLRHSTVIGIVGAGGIGQTLSASFSRYDFDFASAILLTIAAMVAFGEWFSDWARRRLR